MTSKHQPAVKTIHFESDLAGRIHLHLNRAAINGLRVANHRSA